MGRWLSKAVAVAMGCAMALMLSCGVAWADDAAAVETGEYANASIEISESNFPDAALRAILMRYDVNANDALDLGEVEHLVIESSDVKNLEGVGGIPGLQSLEVQSSPRIVEIRLGECTDLTTLVVNDCANLSKIDLSGCVVLESISCDGNALRDVVFPADPSPIVSLSCAGNAIESLDLSLFASLQLLNCENNLLKQITFPAQTIGNLSFAIQRGTDKGKELRGWSFSQGGLPDAVDLTDEGIGPEDYASFVAGRSVFAVWQNRDFSDGTWVYADGGRRYQLSDGTFCLQCSQPLAERRSILTKRGMPR